MKNKKKPDPIEEVPVQSATDSGGHAPVPPAPPTQKSQ